LAVEQVTLRRVAETAGVSPMTVSNVIRGRGRVSAETGARVREVAERLGYRPNRSARSVRAGRTGNIALISSRHEERSILSAAILKGIHRELARYRLHFSFGELDDARLTDPEALRGVLEAFSADGLLINYKWQTPSAFFELVDRLALPAVWLADRRRHDAVFPDIGAGVGEATRRLVARGHRRIALVQPERIRRPATGHVHYSAVDGRRGYEKVLRRAGLSPERIDEAALAGRLAGRDRPTGLVCQGAHAAARSRLKAAEAGLAVPEALSIVAVAHETGHQLGLPFAQVVMPASSVGEQAVRMLVRKIEAPGEHLASCAVPMPWRPGPTLAPPPGACPGATGPAISPPITEESLS